MIEHIVRFENAAHFVRDYEAHLSHDGLILPIEPAPPVYTSIKLTLLLPPNQLEIALSATVVAALPHGVGVQIEPMKGAVRELFHKQLEECRSLAGSPATPSAPEAGVPSVEVSAVETSAASISGLPAFSPSSASLASLPSASLSSLPSASLSSLPSVLGSPSQEHIIPEATVLPASPDSMASSLAMAQSVAPEPLTPTHVAHQATSVTASEPTPRGPAAVPAAPLAHDAPSATPAPPLPFGASAPFAQGESPVESLSGHSLNVPVPTLATHFGGGLTREIAPSLQVGALDSFLLPDSEHPFVSVETRPPEPPAPSFDYEDAPRLRQAPTTAPPPSIVPVSSADDLLPGVETALNFFPPEEIHQKSLSSQQIDAVRQRGGQSSASWSQVAQVPEERLSLSSAHWPSPSYSYDALPAAHFTPPPSSILTPRLPSKLNLAMSGALAESSCFGLLLSLSAQDATGMLHLLAMDATYNIFFHEGDIVCITEEPAPEHHLLGQIMVELGHIGPRVHQDLVVQSRQTERKIGELIMAAEYATLREVAQGLRHQLQRRIGCVSRLTEGHYTFYDKRLPSKKTPLAPPTAPSRLLFRALIDTYGQRSNDHARQHELPFVSQFVARSEQGLFSINELQLSANESAFWNELLNGKLPLRDVYKASSFSRRRTHATIFALCDLGLLHFQPEVSDDEQLQEIVDFFHTRYKMIGKDSYFNFLGLNWSASQEDLKTAFAKMQEDYDISQREGDWPESLIAMSDAIMMHLDEAKDNLLDGRNTLGQRNVLTSPSQLKFSAGLLLKQADLAMFRREHEEAVSGYRKVIELYPEHAEAQAKLSAAMRFTTKKSEKADAESSEENASTSAPEE